MSDQSQGEGWWQASDGKWYPPPRPDAPAQPAATEPVATAPDAPVTQPFGPPPAAGQYGPPIGPPIGAPPGGPPAGPKRSGLGRGPIIGIAAAVVVLVAALAFFLTRDDGKKKANVSANQSEQTGTSDQSNRSDSTDQSTDASSDSGNSSSRGEVPAGFKVLKDDTEGVSIAVPNDFVEIDPSLFLNSSNQSAFSSENPDLAPFLSAGNTFLSGSVLAASGSTDDSPGFVVVAKSPQRFDPSDPQFASELEGGLSAAGGSHITTANVTLPAGKAVRVGVTLDIDAGSSTGTVSETLFFVNVGRTTWGVIGVTVGGPASDVFDQIAKTFAVSS